MPAMELLSGFVTAPDTTQTNLTMASGNSLTIRDNKGQGQVHLLQAWADVQLAGILRIKSPNLHDDVQGIRLRTFASEVDPLLPEGIKQKLISQDDLTVDLSGSSTSGDIESACMLIFYDSLPGIEARLAKWSEIASRIKHIMTVENTLALGTSGGYSGEKTIVAEFDLLKANQDYALLGYIVSAECAAIRYRGSELGNLGVGGPGNDLDRNMTAGWFKDLSVMYDLPTIPILNSANKNSILVDGVQDENGTDVTVNHVLAELSS